MSYHNFIFRTPYCFVTAACFFILLSEQELLSKNVTFSTKIELVTQAYTKIPCVNTEKPMGTQDNFSQSKQGCCKWETLVDTENSLSTQGNLCIDTTFFDRQKLCGVQNFSIVC